MSRTRSDENEAIRREAFVRDYLGTVIVSGGVAYTLAVVTCAVEGCTSLARVLDRFAPYHMEANRCAKHAEAK